jgi:hypothetical protein
MFNLKYAGLNLFLVKIGFLQCSCGCEAPFHLRSIHFHTGQYSKMMNLIRLRHRLVIGGLGVGKGKTDAQFCIYIYYIYICTS